MAEKKRTMESVTADILMEALPYIEDFYGKTVVVKYGGNAMVNDTLKEKVMEDIALMRFVGIHPVIVHGGGPEITWFLKKIGKESSFVSGLRVTDAETAEVAEMVLDGKINSEIVKRMNRRGVRAVGLSGEDANLIRARKKLAKVYDDPDSAPKEVDIGYVGEVAAINTDILETLIKNDYVPVIAPMGVGVDGENYNINADYVAAKVAGALKAERLILLTDVEGVYEDFDNKDSFISILTAAKAREYIKDGTIKGGMIPKVDCCVEAVRKGVERATILDGRVKHSILIELLSKVGAGTMFQ